LILQDNLNAHNRRHSPKPFRRRSPTASSSGFEWHYTLEVSIDVSPTSRC
jgi:hypothetical protein